MYWFVVWSFVAVFSYNYDAADANACITRDAIDRLKVELKGHIDDEISNVITDDGMYHLPHFVFHMRLTGSSYECLTSLLTLCQFYWWRKPEYTKKPLSIFITYGCIDFTSSEFQLNSWSQRTILASEFQLNSICEQAYKQYPISKTVALKV